ncbi:MAG: hypothetical protein OQK98_10535 [Gammaproteobacteria bacterium]|nr:hypothetical protein [Gammaproteobacteria bacterium]
MQRLKNYVVVISFVLLLQACNTQADVSNKTSTHAGYYVYGVEVNVFQPCNKKDTYWVTGSEKLLSHLVNTHEKLTTKPYENIFIKFTGSYSAKALDGFAIDYEGQVKIDKVLELRKVSAGDCTAS